MLNDNLKTLRKINKYTQEQIAEKLGVSRQAVAKWESGETMPDLNNCIILAKLYDVTLDNLVTYDAKEIGVMIPPKGKYMLGTVVVDASGRVKLTEKARQLFDVHPGDELLLLGAEGEGLALVKKDEFVQAIEEFHHILRED